MAQQIKVQDGVIVYSTPDPFSIGVDFKIKGQLTLGNNPYFPAKITTNSGHLELSPNNGDIRARASDYVANVFGFASQIQLYAGSAINEGVGGNAYLVAGDGPYSAGQVVIGGGYSVNGTGGLVNLTGGNTESPTDLAGIIQLIAGTNTTDPALSASIQMITNGLERFLIGPDGDFRLNLNYGTAGQVLTSAGEGFPTTWTTPGGAGPTEPLDQLVIGTGPGVTSFSTAKYVGITTGLEINNNPSSFPINSEAVTVDNPGDILIYGSNNSGIGIDKSASIYMFAGIADNINPTTTAGEFIIRSGRNQAGSTGPTRGASEILLTSHSANNLSATASSVLVYAGGTTDGNTVAGPRNGGAVNIRAGHGRNVAGTFTISAGNSIGLSASTQYAGDMYISAGNVNGVGGSGAASGFAGSVYITAGRNLAPGNPNSGSIIFSTKNIDRLAISDTGEFLIQGSTGTAGQVLTSQGTGTTPTWETPVTGGSAITINTQSSDYTLQLSDAFDTLIRITKATAAIVTIPNDTTANLPIGSAVLISWNGLGQVTIGYEAGVTVDTPDTYDIGKQFGKITAIKTGANHWEIEGNLVPL